MIDRALLPIIEHRLDQFPAVALLGPRQAGKTTLARLVADSTRSLYLDLEDPADLEKLEDARGYLGSRSDHLIVLDEIQRVPGLFRVLRGLIDERVRNGERSGHFLLLGSASMDLLRQSSESLAGRIAYLELAPFDVREVENQVQLWIRGGFPLSFLASSDQESALWRENFIRTYIERDIPLLGPRIPGETLRRFWTMLAHGQGGLWNAASLARSLAVDGKTVAKYLDLMVDLLLVRRLTPYFANVRKRLAKSPKIYVRDSGLVHTLLRLDDEEGVLGHPVVGMSWEGFVIETLIRACPDRTRPSFYRTATGVEIDLVLELPGNRLWAIEIKRGHSPKVEKSLRVAIEDIQPDQAFLVYSGDERFSKGGGLEAIGLEALTEELNNLQA